MGRRRRNTRRAFRRPGVRILVEMPPRYNSPLRSIYAAESLAGVVIEKSQRPPSRPVKKRMFPPSSAPRTIHCPNCSAVFTIPPTDPQFVNDHINNPLIAAHVLSNQRDSS